MELLEISGSMAVPDALNCQKQTAKAIKAGKADYLLNVKENQPQLKQDIEEYIQEDALRKIMDSASGCEKNRGRIERRTAYITSGIHRLAGVEEREGLQSRGAVNTRFSYKEKTGDERHYCIPSRKLSARELLKYARNEWPGETMRRLLDARFGEDSCRIQDEDIRRSLNIVRKIALNSVGVYERKNRK